MGRSIWGMEAGHPLIVDMDDPDPVSVANDAPITQGQRSAPVSGEAEAEHRALREGEVLKAVEALIDPVIEAPEQEKATHKIDFAQTGALQFFCVQSMTRKEPRC